MDSLGIRHFHSVIMPPNSPNTYHNHSATLMAPTAIKPSSSAANPRVPIEYIKAKRREVEQRLEAVLALQQQQADSGDTITNGNGNTNNTNGAMSHQYYSHNNMNNSYNNWSSSSFTKMDHYKHGTNDSSSNQPRVDSSDWLATLGSLLPSSSNSNCNCNTNTSCHQTNNVRDQATSSFSFANYSYANNINNRNYGSPPSQRNSNATTSNAFYTLNNAPMEELPTLPSPSLLGFVNSNYNTDGAAAANTTVNQEMRRVSQDRSVQDTFVLSDRLAEIMPDLDVSGLITTTKTNNDVSDLEDMNNLFVHTTGDYGWFKTSSNTKTNANANAVTPITATSSSGCANSRSSNCFQDQQQDLSAIPIRMLTATSRVSSTSSFTSSCASSNAVVPTLNCSSTCQNKETTKPRASITTNNRNKRKLGRPSAFPQKLFTMLNDIQQPENAHLCDVVNFVNDGSAFQIYDNDAFVTEILPRFFKMTSFSSFQRQLQLYNFKRVTKGGAYHHTKFHRDHPEQLSQMVRKQSKPSTFVLSLDR